MNAAMCVVPAAVCGIVCGHAESNRRPEHRAAASDPGAGADACVLQSTCTVQVTVDGGKDFVAKVLGQDEDKDVAVLQVEEKAVRPRSPVLAPVPAWYLPHRSFTPSHTRPHSRMIDCHRSSVSINSGDTIHAEAWVSPARSHPTPSPVTPIFACGCVYVSLGKT